MPIDIASFRRPSESGKLKTTVHRIVQFLVKKHELLMNKELHSLPAGHTVEHILPKKPAKGAWAHWSADGMLVLIVVFSHLAQHLLCAMLIGIYLLSFAPFGM